MESAELAAAVSVAERVVEVAAKQEVAPAAQALTRTLAEHFPVVVRAWRGLRGERDGRGIADGRIPSCACAATACGVGQCFEDSGSVIVRCMTGCFG
jgi:hypothetical protein